MEERSTIAIKNDSAIWMYGVSGLLIAVLFFAVIVKMIMEGGSWYIILVPAIMIGSYAVFLFVMAATIARMPEVLLAQGDGGIWILSHCPKPLFVATGDITGVRIVRTRLFMISHSSCPIAIGTPAGEIVIHAVADVDVVHDRIVDLIARRDKNTN